MQIQVKQHRFAISDPYQPGLHNLTIEESQVLNAARADYIRNSAIKIYYGLLVKHKLMLTQQQFETLRLEVERLDETFKFKQRRGLNFPKLGTVEYEAQLVAAEQVEAESRRTGEKLSSRDFEEAVACQLKHPDVQQEARVRIEERMKASSRALEDLL